MELLIKYLFLGITLAISIGPVNIELIKRGVTKGFLPSWLVGIGGMTADFIILFIIYLGLGAYFTSDSVQLIFGCLGSIMLMNIGFQNTRKNTSYPNENVDSNTLANGNEKKSFTTGFLLAIANPLNIVFWTGIYSSLLTVTITNLITPLSLIASIFVGITISNMILAMMSSMGKSYVKPSNLRFISLTSGIVLIGYGFWMGYTTISLKILIVLRTFFS